MLTTLAEVSAEEASAEPWRVGSPYPGLRPFSERDTQLFFGREREVAELLGLLEQRQLVVVHGSSGCGKSSLVRAGLLPLFRLDALANEKSASVAIIRPADEGGPLLSLARKLCAQFGELSPASDGNEPDTAWATMLTTSNDWVRDLGDHANRARSVLCIVFDQFEEIFAADKAGYSAQVRRIIEFLNGLGEASPEGTGLGGRPLSVIVTMRSDYLGNCASWEGFAETVNRSQYLLPRITNLGLLRAIYEPAHAFGGSVTDDVADSLLRVVKSELDGLPIVQHALMRAWRMAKGAHDCGPPCVDVAALAAVGGAASALSDHADEVLSQATGDDPVLSECAEWMLRALCDLDSDGRIVRRSVTLANLSGESGVDVAVLGRLLMPFRCLENSLIVPGEEEEIHPDTILTVSHEALLRQWGRISDLSLDDRGQVLGYAYRELQDGLVWRALSVQAAQYAQDGSSILGPASTEQRLPWYRKIERRPGWIARHQTGGPVSSADAETQWTHVNALMNASETNLISEREKLSRERKLVAKLQSSRTKARRFQFIAAVLGLSVITLGATMYSAKINDVQAELQRKKDELQRNAEVANLFGAANFSARRYCASRNGVENTLACVDQQVPRIFAQMQKIKLATSDKLATPAFGRNSVPSSPYGQSGVLGDLGKNGGSHNAP